MAGGVMKARNASRGDWIKVGGRAVQVTEAEHTMRRGRHVVKVSYGRGSRSGILVRGADTGLSRLYGQPGKR
jgi:hypothetical protein